MSTTTKALQLNVGVHEATNSVRKSVIQYGVNYVSVAGAFRETKMTIAAGHTRTLEGLQPSSATVIHVSKPVQIRILKDATTLSPATEIVMLVRRLFILDETYSRILVTAIGQDTYLTAHQA